MKKIKFAYNEPMIGQIETNDALMSEEDALRLIEREYPEAIDIEIIEFHDLD